MTSRSSLSLSALLLAGVFAGCDTEPVDSLDVDRAAAEPDDEPADAVQLAAAPIDAHVTGHVNLDVLRSAPWLADAMKKSTQAMNAELGPCADVLQQAASVTFGATDERAFEAYLVGTFDAAVANACSDHIEAEVARHAPRLDEHPKPEAVLLADGVFVVFGGDLTPSRDRLERLLAADPSPGEPMWVTASMTDHHPVEQLKAWANPASGLRVFAEVAFADEQKAAELFGRANLGLAAMSMSGEVGDLASAIDLRSNGKALTAKVELNDAQMKTVVAKAQARHHAHSWHGHEGGHLQVEIDAD